MQPYALRRHNHHEEDEDCEDTILVAYCSPDILLHESILQFMLLRWNEDLLTTTSKS
jgi:hypothetical protein